MKNILIIATLLFSSINLFAQAEITSSKIVKIGNLNIEVSDYNKSIFKIDSLVTKLRGFIAEENEATFKAKITNEIIIRIPTVNFSTLVYEISEISTKVSTKDIKAVKVDKAISNLTERLNAKNEIKARYLTLVEKSKISIEIAELERKISQVSSEIHSLQKAIGNYNESSVSTLNIYMKQQVEIKGQGGAIATRDLSKATVTQFLKNFLLYSLIPIVLLLVYYFFIHKNIQRAKRKKRRTKSGSKSPW